MAGEEPHIEDTVVYLYEYIYIYIYRLTWHTVTPRVFHWMESQTIALSGVYDVDVK